MPIYKIDNDTYNIPDDVVEQFEKDNPKALVQYSADGDDYDIPVSEKAGFLEAFPGAKYREMKMEAPQPETKAPKKPVEAPQNSTEFPQPTDAVGNVLTNNGQPYGQEVLKRYNSPDNKAGNFKDLSQIAKEVEREQSPSIMKTTGGAGYIPDHPLNAIGEQEQFEAEMRRLRANAEQSEDYQKLYGKFDEAYKSGQMGGTTAYAQAYNLANEMGLDNAERDKLLGKINRQYAKTQAGEVVNSIIEKMPERSADPLQALQSLYYDRDLQQQIMQTAAKMGNDYDQYVNMFVKPQLIEAMKQKYGGTDTDWLGVKGLFSNWQHVTDKLESQDVSNLMSQHFAPAIDKAIDDAEERAVAKEQEIMKDNPQYNVPGTTSGFGTIGAAAYATRQGNKVRDPELIQKEFEDMLLGPSGEGAGAGVGKDKLLEVAEQEIWKDETLKAEIDKRSKQKGMTAGEYTEKYVVPQLIQSVRNRFEQTFTQRAMPKSTLEHIMKGLTEDNILTMIANRYLRTEAQQQYANMADAMTAQGENPNVDPSVWTEGARLATGMAADFWLWGGWGKLGAKATGELLAKRVAERAAAEHITTAAAARLIEEEGKQYLKKGIVEGMMRHIPQSAVTLGGAEATTAAVQGIRDREDAATIIGNTLGAGASGATTGALFGVTGGSMGRLTSRLNGSARLAGKLAGFGVEASTMYTAEELQKMAQGEDAFQNPYDVIEIGIKLGFIKASANPLATGARLMEAMRHPVKAVKRAMTPDNPLLTEDDVKAIRESQAGAELMDALTRMRPERSTDKGERKGYISEADAEIAANAYRDFMMDPDQPWERKQKVAHLLGGIVPPVGHEVTTELVDTDNGTLLRTRNLDGQMVREIRYDSHDAAQEAADGMINDLFDNETAALREKINTAEAFTRFNDYFTNAYAQAAEKIEKGLELTKADQQAIYLHQHSDELLDIFKKVEAGEELSEEGKNLADLYRQHFEGYVRQNKAAGAFTNEYEKANGLEPGTIDIAIKGHSEAEAKKLANQNGEGVYQAGDTWRTESEQKAINDYQQAMRQRIAEIEGQGVTVENATNRFRREENLLESQDIRPTDGGADDGGAGSEPVGGSGTTGEGENPADETGGGSTPPPAGATGGGSTPQTQERTERRDAAYNRGTAVAENEADLPAIGQSARLATARLMQQMPDDNPQLAKVRNNIMQAVEIGDDEEADRLIAESNLTAQQQEAVEQWRDAIETQYGIDDAVTDQTEQFEEQRRAQLEAIADPHGNVTQLRLKDGTTAYYKSGDLDNHFGGVMAVTEDGQTVQLPVRDIANIGQPMNVDDILAGEVEQYAADLTDRYQAMFDGTMLTAGQQVDMVMANQPFTATVLGTDQAGNIIFQMEDGSQMPIHPEDAQAAIQEADAAKINQQLQAEAESARLAEQQERFTKGILGYAEGQPDLTAAQTSARVAVEYIQSQLGADGSDPEKARKQYLENIKTSQEQIKMRLDEIKKEEEQIIQWIEGNDDIADPAEVEQVKQKGAQLLKEKADLMIRQTKWGDIYRNLMTADELSQMEQERRRVIFKARSGYQPTLPQRNLFSGEDRIIMEDGKPNFGLTPVSNANNYLLNHFQESTDAEQFVNEQRLALRNKQRDEVQPEINRRNDILNAYASGHLELTPDEVTQLTHEVANLEAQQDALSKEAIRLREIAEGIPTLYERNGREEQLTPAEQRGKALDKAASKEDKLRVARTLYNIYPEALDIINNQEPRDLEEFIADNLGLNSMNWEGYDMGDRHIAGVQEAVFGKKGATRGIGKGYTTNAFNQYLAPTGEGKGFDEIVHAIYESQPDIGDNKRWTTEDISNALQDMLRTAQKPSDISHRIIDNRIAEAEDIVQRQEELDREAEEEAKYQELQQWAEAHHLNPEEMEAYQDYLNEKPWEFDEEVINQIIADDEAKSNQSGKEMDSQHPDGSVGSKGEGSESQVPERSPAEGTSENPTVAGQPGAEGGTGGETIPDNNVPGGTQVEIAPIGQGDFGPIYDQFKGKAKEAIDFLIQKKDGEAIGALSHKDVGDIDLVWGEEGTGKSDGYGLAKLVKYHPEVLDNLQDILDEMSVASRSDNRINLESKKYKAAVRLTWNEESKTWLLTVFEKKPSATDKTTDTVGNQNDSRSDTALPRTEGISGGKDTKNINTIQENGEKSFEETDNSFTARLANAKAETDVNPTQAQKEAGNYKMGHIKFGGYQMSIENPKGSIRSGLDKNGKPWSIEMKDTYGYIGKKYGTDGDHLDFFINDDVDLDNFDGRVYVVDQKNEDGTFDEHKVMYGYPSWSAAKKAYSRNYEPGWWDKRVMQMTGVRKNDFDKWLADSDHKTKPFAEYYRTKMVETVSSPADQLMADVTDRQAAAAQINAAADERNRIKERLQNEQTTGDNAVSHLSDAYKLGDKDTIRDIADRIREIVKGDEDIMMDDNIDPDWVEDYDGNDPDLLAQKYIVRLSRHYYTDYDNDIPYIVTGIESPKDRPYVPESIRYSVESFLVNDHKLDKGELKGDDLRKAMRKQNEMAEKIQPMLARLSDEQLEQTIKALEDFPDTAPVIAVQMEQEKRAEKQEAIDKVMTEVEKRKVQNMMPVQPSIGETDMQYMDEDQLTQRRHKAKADLMTSADLLATNNRLKPGGPKYEQLVKNILQAEADINAIDEEIERRANFDQYDYQIENGMVGEPTAEPVVRQMSTKAVIKVLDDAKVPIKQVSQEEADQMMELFTVMNQQAITDYAIQMRENNRKRYAIINVRDPYAVPKYFEKKKFAEEYRVWANRMGGMFQTFDLDKTQDQSEELKQAANIQAMSKDVEFMFDDGAEPKPIFVSNALKAVEAISQQKATPDQWLAMIQKNGGLKAGEDKWLGLSDWLNEQKESGKKSVTKQEVEDYIRQNQIQVEEQRYAEDIDRMQEAMEKKYPGITDAFYIESDGYDDFVVEIRDKQKAIEMFNRYNEDDKIDPDNYDKYDLGMITEWMSDLYTMTPPDDNKKAIESTRLKYTTQGLQDKREIALLVPGIEPYNENDHVHFGDAGNGRAVAWIRFGDTTVSDKRLHNQRYVAEKEFYDFLDKMSEKYDTDGDGEHTIEKLTPEEREEAERLNKARLDAIKSEDATAKKVLVIDEIQSKRHQDAREKGYAEKTTKAKLEDARKKVDFAQKEYDNYVEMLKKQHEGEAFEDFYAYLPILQKEMVDSLEQDVYKASEEFEKAAEAANGVPGAPFEKNWHELAMKRMLRYAAENGYDKIAWTTGDQQAERYNIGDKIKSIAVEPYPNGRRIISLDFKHGDGYMDLYQMEVDNDGNVIGGDFKGKILSDVVGKELAVKMMAVKDYQKFENEDLRVGGEGMKGFYDEILPRFMDKYGKKWGVKTGEIELPDIGDQTYRMNGDGKMKRGLTMHSIDVTPEMKESVMQGQPMFQKGTGGRIYGWTDGNGIFLTPLGMNPNSPMHEYTHIWDMYIQKHDPKLWKEMVKTFKRTAAWKEVRENPNYRNIWEDENRMASEVHSRLTGARSQEEFDKAAADPNNKDAENVIKAVKDVLRRFWEKIAHLFGHGKDRLEEFVLMPLRDALKGFNPITGDNTFDPMAMIVQMNRMNRYGLNEADPRGKAVNEIKQQGRNAVLAGYADEKTGDYILLGEDAKRMQSMGGKGVLTKENGMDALRMTPRQFDDVSPVIVNKGYRIAIADMSKPEEQPRKSAPKSEQQDTARLKGLMQSRKDRDADYLQTLINQQKDYIAQLQKQMPQEQKLYDAWQKAIGTKDEAAARDRYDKYYKNHEADIILLDSARLKLDDLENELAAKQKKAPAVEVKLKVDKRPPVQSLIQGELFSDEDFALLPEKKEEKPVEKPKNEQKSETKKSASLSDMSDNDLLKGISEKDGKERRDYIDAYDQRHLEEQKDENNVYYNMLDSSETPLEEAYGMYDSVFRQFKDGGYASPERTKLLAQIDALEEYIEWQEEREAERRMEEEEAGETTQQTAAPDEAKQKFEQQQEEVRQIGYDLTSLSLRPLEEGETSHVQRRYVENGMFSFTGAEHIKSIHDVAYVFRELENASVENTFLVLEKDGEPTIIHLAIGGYTASYAPHDVALAAYQEIDPEKVYFIHNHPSGNIKCSKADQQVMADLRKVFGKKLQDGIIIDTKSGKFGLFDEKTYLSEATRPKNAENEVPMKVYSFSKSVFDEDWNPETAFRVFDSKDIAAFISSHRLGEHKKMSLIVMDQGGHITGNIFLPFTKLKEAATTESIDLITKYVEQMGGNRCILYGNYDYEMDDARRIKYINGKLKDRMIRLADMIHIDHSADEAQMLNEPEPEMPAVGEPVTDTAEIERLEQEPKEIGYRNVVLNEDGSMGSPMANRLGKKGTGRKPTSMFDFGQWERSDEHPELATEDGKIDLIKPDGKTIDSVDYNPYIHIRPTLVNKQFKQAWERPNLVYVRTEYPQSELTSGYHANKAKLPVGKHPWNGGELILSRYDKPLEIVPWEDVADDWMNEFESANGIHFDIIPPKLLPILAERGATILPPHKNMGKACNEAYEQFKDDQAKKVAFSPLRSVIKEAPRLKRYHDMIRDMFNNPDFDKEVYSREHFDLGSTPEYIKELGIKGDYFTISMKNINTHRGKDSDHNLTEEEWHQLPRALKQPFVVTRYNDSDDQFRMYVNILHDGKFVAVGVDVKRVNQGRNIPMLEVNSVKTVFAHRGGIGGTEKVVAYDKNITPEQEALLRGLNFREYPTIQELSGAKIDNISETSKKNKEKFTEIASETGNLLGGVKVKSVTYDEADDQLRREIEDGTKAIYDPNTGEVTLLTDNIEDEADAKRTVCHEKLGHEGLVALLGSQEEVDKFGQFVFKSAGKSIRHRIINKANENDPEWKDNLRFSHAAQEVIADIAEDGPRTEEEFSLWDKIKHYLIRFLNKMGLRIRGLINDHDLAYYILKTGEALKKWNQMSEAEKVAASKQATEHDIMRSRRGKPRKRKDESMAQYLQRLREWEKWKIAEEKAKENNDPMPDAEQINEKWHEQFNQDVAEWRRQNNIPADAEGLGAFPKREAGETPQDYAARVADYEAEKDAWRDAPKVFDYLQRANEEYQRLYREWKERYGIAEAESVDLGLYEGDPDKLPHIVDPEDLEADMRAEADLVEAVGIDMSREGARRHTKLSLIERRKNLESANAKDAIWIHNLVAAINEEAKRQGVEPKQLREAIADIIEGTYFEDVVRDEQGNLISIEDISDQLPIKMTDGLQAILDTIKDWYDEFFHVIDDAGLRNDAGYIEEGYVNHVWSKEKTPVAVWEKYIENFQRTKSPNMRERLFKTYRDGEDIGLVRKYKDIADILAYYSVSNNEAVANKKFLDDLSFIVVEEQNTDGETVSVLPLLNSSKPNIAVSDRYQMYHVPGVGDVYVLKDIQRTFSNVFGTMRTQDIPEWLSQTGKVYDTVSSTAKKIELSFSAFHMGALTEVAMAQMRPDRALKALAQYIIFDCAKAGTIPAYAHPEDFKLAASHLVQLGATQDYSAADVNNVTEKFRELVRELADSEQVAKKGAGYAATPIAAALDYINKGMDKVLWNYLHDGLKIACFKMFAEQIEKRVEKQGLSAEQREQLLDEAGQYVNDTFGGQYWELLNVSPALIKWLRRAFLSPDWLISTQRHFLANFGFGSIYSESGFLNYIQYNVDNLKRGAGMVGKAIGIDNAWANIDTDENRRFRSRNAKICYLIGVLGYFYILINAINQFFRSLDVEKEEEKADEIRKTNPDYKSPYELAYPDGMKWYDYTMYGNTIGQQTHLFLGRYDDGTEWYARWGKQFREFPELFMGRHGVEFPTPLMERMSGKANPIGRYLLYDLPLTVGMYGYKQPRETQEIAEKYGNTVALLAMTAKKFLPYSVPTQQDKEFKMFDLVMPSQKGFTRWKAVDYFKTYIQGGDMDGVMRTYNAAVMNGIDAEDCLKAAIATVKATQRKELQDGIIDLQTAMNAYDAEQNTAEKKRLRQKIFAYLAEQDYKAFTRDEAREQVDQFLNGTAPTDNDVNKYVKLATSADVRDEYRLEKIRKMAKKYADEVKTADGDRQRKLEDAYGNWLDIYDIITKANREINHLKRQLGKEGEDDAATMDEIRSIRRETQKEVDEIQAP